MWIATVTYPFSELEVCQNAFAAKAPGGPRWGAYGYNTVLPDRSAGFEVVGPGEGEVWRR